MLSRSTTGAVLVALSALLFGSVGVLAREAYAAGFAAGGLLALRFGFSALIFATAHGIHAGRNSGAAPLRLDRSAVRGALFGAAITALQVAFLFAAFARVPVAIAVALHYTYPAIVMVISSVATRRVPRPRAVATLIVSLAGVALVVLAAAQGGGSALGCAFALGSGLLYAVNIVLASRLLRTDSVLKLGTSLQVGMAIVFSGWFLLHDQARLDVTTAGWGWLALLVILGTALPIAALFAGLKHVAPTVAATISTLEPVAAAGYAALLLGEHLSPQQVLGGALVLLASIVCATSGAAGSSAGRMPPG